MTSNAQSYDALLAYKSKNETKLQFLHYFEIDGENGLTEIDKMNYFNHLEYNGFVVVLDMNMNTVDVKKYKKGKKDNKT